MRATAQEPESQQSTMIGHAALDRLQRPEDFLRALAQDHGGYLVSTGLLALGNLLLLPLVTRIFTPATLGLYSLVEAGLTLGATAGLMGQKFAYLYFFARQPRAAHGALLGNALLIAGGAALPLGLLLALAYGSPQIMARFGAAPLAQAWLLPALLLGGAVQAMLITALRAERRIAQAGLLAVVNLVVWLAASTALVLGAELGLPGLLLGQLCGQVAAILLAWLRPAGWRGLAVSPTQLGPMLAYGMPLMLGLLARYALDSLSRFLIAAWAGIDAAADYLIALRIAGLFDALLALPFFMAWGGLVHHALQRPAAAAILSRVSATTIAIAALLLALLLAAQPWLFALLTGAARPDLAPLFAACLFSLFCVLAKSPLGAGLLRLPGTGWSLRNNLLTLGLFLPLAWPAVHLAGATGAAVAIALANLAALLALFWQAQRHCRQTLPVLAWLLPALLAAICFAPVWPGSMRAWLLGGMVLLAFRLLWQSVRPGSTK